MALAIPKGNRKLLPGGAALPVPCFRAEGGQQYPCRVFTVSACAELHTYVGHSLAIHKGGYCPNILMAERNAPVMLACRHGQTKRDTKKKKKLKKKR